MKDLQTDSSSKSVSPASESPAIDHIVEQIVAQQQAGQQPQIQDYLDRYPQMEEEIREVWSVLMVVNLLSPDQSVSEHSSPGSSADGPSLKLLVESRLPESESKGTREVVATPGEFEASGAFIGRYKILRQLGRGGFGTVYLGSDTELDRLVAIKLAHLHRMASGSAKRSYLLEARTLARLDHPNIVPVYDFGMMTDGRCFVVSKFVNGQDLAQLLKTKRFIPDEAAQLVSIVADAMDYVHRASIVHRDMKPANILIGNDQKIYVADFGLALAESAIEENTALLGTPSYMSPEQIRREGHRIDGRSDQFSLGVVMYELLTATRPFQGSNTTEVMRQILSTDPVAPAQINSAVPPELNRICMKLLSRLASERYDDMRDLRDDLRHWQELERINDHLAGDHTTAATDALTRSLAVIEQSNKSTQVVPRGLRAYSHRDSYFYLDLVPGVRDRNGLPETLAHWKNWVEAPDNLSEWYRVGVISGPTGCGKSSLMRAGLVPLLGPEVVTIVVEASPDLTEKHLLSQLERCCSLTTDKTLSEIVVEVRRGGGLPPGKKLLIIIDQFEQWLHGNPDPMETELLRAVRQCDSNRVQCLLLIRDDFWLALSRFMKAAESLLLLGRNAMMVDLFDPRHAQKVLTEFGRGYGALPAKPAQLSRDQEQFIEGAIQSLVVQNRIIPVQLALFAEMVKSRDWSLATLERLGGSIGIGSQFLSESFSVGYAPARQRLHADAAKSVLMSMLPTTGTDIKTRRRTLEELRAASGYTDRDAFQSLMTVLETELKLITATDAYDRTRSDSSTGEIEPTTYQLSHDFLVPSIRDWLSTQQKRTWRGRIEQTIHQQAEYWSHNRQRRFLPSFWEWLQALYLLPRNRLGVLEAEMLRARDRLSLIQIGIAAAILLIASWGIQSTLRALSINSLVSRLQVAEASQVPRLLAEIDLYGSSAQAALKSAIARDTNSTRESFLLQLAQLPQQPELQRSVLDYALHHAELTEVELACQALQPYATEIADECWRIIEAAEIEKQNKSSQLPSAADDLHLHALVLLAAVDPGHKSSGHELQDDRWTKHGSTATMIAVRSATQHPNQYNIIVESLRPISDHLVPVLQQTIGLPDYDSQAFSSLSLLRDFTSHDHRLQTVQCLSASKWQRPYIVPTVDKLDAAALRAEFTKAETLQPGDPKQLTMASRRAMAATLMLLLQQTDPIAWTVFHRSTDLTSRSLAIQLATEFRVSSNEIQQRLREETDPGVLTALLQILGSITVERTTLEEQTLTRIAELVRNHPDAGVHSSAHWCLTQWNDTSTLSSVAKASNEDHQNGPREPKRWLVTPSGALMVKIDGRSVESIGRDFLISAHEVTIDQFRSFTPGRYFSQEFGPAGDCPANIIKWKDAVAYCNWLSAQEGLMEFYPNDQGELESWQPSESDLNGSGYRLPQDAEWEFAARGGTTTDRPFGTDESLMVHYDWCLNNTASFTARHRSNLLDLYADPNTARSKPVGQLLPNEYGLFDVLGNVAEWCNDLSPHNRVERAIRGGAAGGAIRYMSATRKGTAQPNEEFNSNGFRVVRTLPANNR